MVLRESGENFAAKERVLIIEVNWLGDVLLSTPAIRAIRKKHAGAYIAALVVPRCKEILLGNNYLDEVMVLDEGGRHRGFWGKCRLIRDLRLRRFDRVYLFHRSFTRALCTFLAGIKVRVGAPTKKRRCLLTEPVVIPEGLHRADTYYYLVQRRRIPDGERYCDFFVSGNDKKYINGLLAQRQIGVGKKIVALHVAGNWDLKRWPKERFVCLCDILSRDHDADVVITGSFKDDPLAQEIAASSRVRRPFVVCGLTTLKQLGALFQRCDLVVSADSGPLHIAAAVGARTIALFGPTSPDVTGPLGRGDFSVLKKREPGCEIPCYKLDCPDNVCMKGLSAEDVVGEAQRRGWLKRAA